MPLVAVSEERGELAVGGGSAAVRVVIDPVDGSVNAKRALPFACVSIAVASGARMEDVEVGFIADLVPARDWWAVSGEGAFCDGDRLAQLEPGPLELLGLETARPERVAAAADALASVGARRLRALGSVAASMCLVAAGRLDAMVTLREVRSVDVAAAQLIVREAGGAVALPGRRRARPRHALTGRWRPATRRRSSAWPTPSGRAEGCAAARAGMGAAMARLRRVDCSESGIRRRRRGKGFEYLDADGRRIAEPSVIERIRELAIPPAWEDVWICPYPMGHIQATGIDAAGRKQYRYHDRWRERRDSEKFESMLRFARSLPKLRRQAAKDLARKGMPREKALACAVRLLDRGFFRIGSEDYAEENDTYGMATMRKRHVTVERRPGHVRLRGQGRPAPASDDRRPRGGAGRARAQAAPRRRRGAARLQGVPGAGST